ncbi:MAG TPA: tRNA (adenosine(37)-N6)-threonylcarbamoyltransferase complex ATPase subunit type 1 TsaE, partial [Burkholderiaceae bacterium]|nr:tRNA (adenosine(37)-N6)-threonylcarbamoyltransferase complex ATPase subunit type 1 TsaE [Burkholderiaceae bacterium]
MTSQWTWELDEPGVVLLAQLIALKIRSGDVLALRGDLGTGKTTLARALIRALLGDDTAEVPSPTFSLQQ